MFKDTKLYKNVTGIYKLTINEHIYIGSSVNLYKRLNVHYRSLKNQTHDNEYLQRCVNKYGIDNLNWEVVEVEDSNIEYIDLLKREKYFIEYYHADLNLKMDPTTQNNCITTSKKVYQFDQFGVLIKEWPSLSEAGRRLGVHESNILKACTDRKRQRLAAGFLWDYTDKYTGELKIIYVFDLQGNFIGKYKDTEDIYLNLFSESSRKTVLSQLKKKIDKNIPYKNIYLSSSSNFKINPNYKPKFKESTDFDKILETNPTIYCFDKHGNFLYEKKFNDFRSKSYVKKAMLSSKHTNIFYSLDKEYIPIRSWCGNSKKIVAINLETGIKSTFNSMTECSRKLFNEEKCNNIGKHLKRGTPYRGFLFKRDN